MLTAYRPLPRELVERYETLRRPGGQAASGGGPQTARHLEDATYTLCVLTGTRQLDTALFVARRQPADAMAQNGSPPR